VRPGWKRVDVGRWGGEAGKRGGCTGGEYRTRSLGFKREGGGHWRAVITVNRVSGCNARNIPQEKGKNAAITSREEAPHGGSIGNTGLLEGAGGEGELPGRTN